METGSALAILKRYSDDYGCRARELKSEGRQVIGYLCALTPVEIITAAGFIPFRIKGDVHEPITRADTRMETIICPLVRSCFDMALKDRYEFIDGLVIPHACDSINRTYDIWKYSLNLPYTHLVNLPHSIDASSVAFYQQEMETFRRSLAKHAGIEITDQSLANAVDIHNQIRSLINELYDLRKNDPPMVAGGDLTKLLMGVVSIPAEEAVELLGKALHEIRNGAGAADKRPLRVMVVGAEVDDPAFIDLIEDSGASVVADDLCPGAREFRSSVRVTNDPMEGLADRYLREVKCGRTYREVTGSYEESLEDRFGHIVNDVKTYAVDGVILYIYKYCDPFGFEVPAMKDYIESKGTPVLYIEDEYSMATIGRLRTRIQAFLEMIG